MRALDWTPEKDAILREEYAKGGRCLKRAMQRLRVTRGIAARRAIALGLTRTNRGWDQEEDDILEALAGAPVGRILCALRFKKFRRSAAAVMRRQRGLGLSSESDDYYTAKQLSVLMGVHHNTISRWIGIGFLVAAKETRRNGRPGCEPRIFCICRQDVRKFLITYVLEWSRFAKPDMFWLVEILSGVDNFLDMRAIVQKKRPSGAKPINGESRHAEAEGA